MAKIATYGMDTSVAQVAIYSARNAVDTQTTKGYIVEITDVSSLRSDAKVVHDQLRADLRAAHDAVVAARAAVKDSARQARQIGQSSPSASVVGE